MADIVEDGSDDETADRDEDEESLSKGSDSD